MFEDSFSWFGNNSKTTEPASKFDWSFGLRDKLNPPPIPAGQPVIPGRPVTQQPQQQQPPPPQDVPDVPITTSSQAVPVTTAAAAGGRRLRLRTKKRSCRCKRK